MLSHFPIWFVGGHCQLHGTKREKCYDRNKGKQLLYVSETVGWFIYFPVWFCLFYLSLSPISFLENTFLLLSRLQWFCPYYSIPCLQPATHLHHVHSWPQPVAILQSGSPYAQKPICAPPPPHSSWYCKICQYVWPMRSWLARLWSVTVINCEGSHTAQN